MDKLLILYKKHPRTSSVLVSKFKCKLVVSILKTNPRPSFPQLFQAAKLL